MQEAVTDLIIALRQAGAPAELVEEVRPATEGSWRAQEDSGDEEIGYVIFGNDNPDHVRYVNMKDAAAAWLGAGGLRRPLLRRRALQAIRS